MKCREAVYFASLYFFGRKHGKKEKIPFLSIKKQEKKEEKMKHIFLQSLFEKGNAGNLPAPFKNNRDSIMGADTQSEYFDHTVYKTVLSPSEWKPINYVHQIERALTRLILPEISSQRGYGGYGFDEEGNFYADYNDLSTAEYDLASAEEDLSDSRRILLKIEHTGKFKACVMDSYHVGKPYLIRTRNFTGNERHSPSAGIYAVMAYLLAKTRKEPGQTPLSLSVNTHFQDIISGFESFDMDLFGMGMRALDADTYSILAYYSRLPDDFKGLMPDLSFLDTDCPEYWDLEKEPVPDLVESYGDSPYLGKERTEYEKNLESLGDNATLGEILSSGKLFLGKNLTEEEKKRVPTGLESLVPSEELLDIASEIKQSSTQPRPCRNILLTGETGTGKTTGARMISAMLGLPYYNMTLSGDKLSTDLTLSCLPNPEKLGEKQLYHLLSSFPDAEATFMDPALAYEKITGRKKPDATENDVNLAKTKILAKALEKASDFIYVESPFVKAFRDGGVIELQEANACKPEILKSLNEALDDLNLLHLPDGQIVRRSPYCVVIATANVGDGYEGVKSFSNDFLARFDQANILEIPDDDILTERVIERTGYEDKNVIHKMLDVMRSIKTVLETCEGQSGACSPRSVYAWARKTRNCKDPYFAALGTIVGLSTQDPEVRIDVLHALETQFTPSVRGPLKGGIRL